MPFALVFRVLASDVERSMMHSRGSVLFMMIVLGALQGDSALRVQIPAGRIVSRQDFTPLHFIYPRLYDYDVLDFDIAEPKHNLGILRSSKRGLFGIQGPKMVKPLEKSAVSVNVTNLPLPVGIKEPLKVLVQNEPLVTSVVQPIEVTSNQLSSYLSSINGSNNAIIEFLVNQTKSRVCPTDSNFGTQDSAPCRRLNSTCYCFFNGIMRNFDDAAALCKAAGFDGLVSLETKAEAKLMSDLLYLLVPPNPAVPRFYFTSGSDKASDTNYVWTTTGQPIDPNESYWRPAPAEPDGGTTENCLVIRHPDGWWLDTDCSSVRNFICELSPVSNAIG